MSEDVWNVRSLKEYVDTMRSADQLATTTALNSAEKAVAAALAAAEKATTKAETAADDRFKATNEFRAQLADQAQTFMPRTEADVRLSALSDKLASETSRNAAGISALTSRMDLNQGQDTGAATSSSANRAVLAIAISAGILLVAVIAAAVTLYASLKP
jgi:hypothetical protein